MPLASTVSRQLRQAGCSGYSVWQRVDGFVGVSDTQGGDPSAQLARFTRALSRKYDVRPDPDVRTWLRISDK